MCIHQSQARKSRDVIVHKVPVYIFTKRRAQSVESSSNRRRINEYELQWEPVALNSQDLVLNQVQAEAGRRAGSRSRRQAPYQRVRHTLTTITYLNPDIGIEEEENKTEFISYALVEDMESTCDTANGYDGHMGLRISAIFVIFIGSLFGSVFPVLAKRLGGNGVPSWLFFIAKYFGSGVIVATAFIHLLASAEDELRDPCLTGPITEYSWTEGIVLMTIVVMFFVELMVMRYSFPDGHGHGHAHGDDLSPSDSESNSHSHSLSHSTVEVNGILPHKEQEHIPGNDHLSHTRDHRDIESASASSSKDPAISTEDYAAQLSAVFILEFGIIFHSVFIGLTLAVSGSDFITLYIVLVFHQTFEGLGLGSRLATLPWPQSKRFTPYLLGIGYSVSTPIATAIGLAVRNSYAPNGQTTLIVNGVFDAISAGVLIYTSLVELMAHEFMFSVSMRRAPLRTVLFAFVLICLGAGLMALLGKWA